MNKNAKCAKLSSGQGQCRPVDRNVSTSWLSPGWFVAQLTAHPFIRRISETRLYILLKLVQFASNKR